MFRAKDFPSPFNVFWIVFSALLSVFVFFVESKSQSLSFYLTSAFAIMSNAFMSSFFVKELKKSDFIIISISDDELFEKDLQNRRKKRKEKMLRLALLGLGQLTLGIVLFCLLKNMYIANKSIS